PRWSSPGSSRRRHRPTSRPHTRGRSPQESPGQLLLHHHRLVAVRLAQAADLTVAAPLVERERRGVRGITADLAHHPAARYGACLHLVVQPARDAAAPEARTDDYPVQVAEVVELLAEPLVVDRVVRRAGPVGEGERGHLPLHLTYQGVRGAAEMPLEPGLV